MISVRRTLRNRLLAAAATFSLGAIGSPANRPPPARPRMGAALRTDVRALALALAVLVSVSVSAQTQTPSGEQATSRNQRMERAKERCRLNRGVDCETAKGLREWLLLERSREESVRDGSRHLPPTQPRPAPSRP